MKTKTKAKKTDRNAEVRDVLKQIVTVVNRGYKDPNAKRLWDILAALRGPDSEHEGNKELTTERIRHLLGFLPTHFLTDGEPLVFDQELSDKIYGEEGSHFAGHISDAVHALKALGYLK